MTNPLATAARAVNSLSPHSAMWGRHLMARAGAVPPIISAGIWDGKLNYARRTAAAQQETTEAQNALEDKGDKPQPFTVTLSANRLAGLNPVSLYKTWCESLGKSNFFFLGLLPLSSDLYILQNVNFRFRGRDCDADGAPIIGTITLSFTPDVVLGRIGKTEKGKNAGMKSGAKAAINKSTSSSIWGDVEKSYTAAQQ